MDTFYSHTSNAPRSLSANAALRISVIFSGLFLSATLAAANPPLHPTKDAQVSPTGLASQVLYIGTGDKSPDANDLVMAHFVGWTPDGKEFQNTYLARKPELFNLEQVFEGWREGLQLMVIGEKRRLWIPDHLGSANPDQGPKGAAIFDVELLAMKSVPNPPPSGTKPPADAQHLSLGAFTKVSVPGKGEEIPGPTGRILTHYIGWGEDGKIFDSTLHRNRPTAFILDQMFGALAEGLQAMKVGERRYVWVPGRIAAGQWPKAPKGDLLFEVELLRILPEEVLQPQDAGEGVD